MPTVLSIPGVLDVEAVRGQAAPVGAAPDLLVEVPHGATSTADFERLAARLKSPLPPALVDFFHVNTDVGAFELGRAAAARFVAAAPTRSALLLRSRIPRTFIDCNRRIDATPAELTAGKVTPGLMPWITDPEDRVLLRAVYDAYVGAVRAAVDGLAPGGAMVMAHSYAPREVDVEVDGDIVANLRRAYAPDVEPTWRLRPAVDVIGRGPDGTSHAPAAVVAALRQALAAFDLEVADSATYPLHPSTLAYEHVVRLPGRALCLEVRRDLLADPFDPFVEMRIGEAKVARLAGALATAIGKWWAETPG
jgi:predicted N-formylglutamate amidohydrolase